jgi:hypothetical protein
VREGLGGGGRAAPPEPPVESDAGAGAPVMRVTLVDQLKMFWLSKKVEMTYNLNGGSGNY